MIRNCLYQAARECAIKGDFYDPLFFDSILENDCKELKSKGKKDLLTKIYKVIGKRLSADKEAYAKEYVNIIKEIKFQ